MPRIWTMIPIEVWSYCEQTGKKDTSLEVPSRCLTVLDWPYQLDVPPYPGLVRFTSYITKNRYKINTLELIKRFPEVFTTPEPFPTGICRLHKEVKPVYYPLKDYPAICPTCLAELDRVTLVRSKIDLQLIRTIRQTLELEDENTKVEMLSSLLNIPVEDVAFILEAFNHTDEIIQNLLEWR